MIANSEGHAFNSYSLLLFAIRPRPHARATAIAAKPRSRSAIRSVTSSSPIWKRIAGPPGAQRSRCGTREVERDGEALEAAPGGADAEQRQRVEERDSPRPAARLEHDAEQPARAGEVALPDRVAGIALERRMQHARDLGPLREPARDLRGRTPGAARAAPPWCAGRAGRDTCRRGRRTGRKADVYSCSALAVAALAETVPSITSEWPPIYLVPDMIDEVDALVERAEIERASPRYCPSARARPWRARPPRSPGRPASRRTASPATRRTRRACCGCDQVGDAGADQRIVIGRRRRRSARARCRRTCASADRRCRSPARGRRP